MTRWTLLFCAALALLGCAAPGRAEVAWGVNGHPITAYPGIRFEAQLDLIEELGATQYRVNLRGDGSVGHLDRMLTMAAERGIELLPILSPPANLAEDSADTIYRISFDHARMMAERFRGRVRVWELANELEVFAILQPCEMRDDGTQYPCEWGPASGVGPGEYYTPRWRKVSAMLDGLSDGVKAGDPKALRAAGTAGWGHLGAFDRMQADGIEWDLTVWHDYERVSEEKLARLATFGKPIWITEFNFPPQNISQEAQAEGLRGMLEHYSRHAKAYRIEAVHHYELLDEPYWQGFESIMGLVELDREGAGWRIGKRKPAFTVYRDHIRRAQP